MPHLNKNVMLHVQVQRIPHLESSNTACQLLLHIYNCTSVTDLAKRITAVNIRAFEAL